MGEKLHVWCKIPPRGKNIKIIETIKTVKTIQTLVLQGFLPVETAKTGRNTNSVYAVLQFYTPRFQQWETGSHYLLMVVDLER